VCVGVCVCRCVCQCVCVGVCVCVCMCRCVCVGEGSPHLGTGDGTRLPLLSTDEGDLCRQRKFCLLSVDLKDRGFYFRL